MRGLKPVVAIYSTFIQRAADQIIHDTAIQNLPVVFALDRAGFVGDDGETHQGLFDIALFRPTPNMTILAPASEAELSLMLDWALNVDAGAADRGAPGPVMIRYPKSHCPEETPAFSLPLESGRGVWLRREGSRVCLAFTGSLYPEAFDAAERLAEHGLEPDLYNLRFLKPIDENYLAELLNSYELLAVIEEGIRDGGFGEYLAAFACQRNCRAEIAVLAVEGDFAIDGRALGTRAELLRLNGLDAEGIAARIKALEAVGTIG
jgi:1-deoxy-D-xylulose-5-phosphate synthase